MMLRGITSEHDAGNWEKGGEKNWQDFVAKPANKMFLLNIRRQNIPMFFMQYKKTKMKIGAFGKSA